MTRACRSLVIALLALLEFGSMVKANDELLVRAKALYVSAGYDEALVLLEQVRQIRPRAIWWK